MSAKKQHRSATDLLKYRKGELSDRERNAFEREMEADPFLKEAMEGMEHAGLAELEDDLLEIHGRMRKRLARRRRVAWYSVAATVASLLIVGTVFLKIHDFNPDRDEMDIPASELLPVQPQTGSPEKSVEAETTDDAVEVESLPRSGDTKSPAKTPGVEVAKTGTKGGITPKPVVEPGPVPEPAPESVPEPTPEKKASEVAPAEEHFFAMEVEEEVMVEEEIMAEAPIEALDIEEPVVDEMVAAEMAAVPRARKTEASKSMMERVALKEESEKKAAGVALAGQPQLVIRGLVSDIDGEPLPGVSIQVKNQTMGTVTDEEGFFELTVAKDQQISVTASFIGMEDLEYLAAPGEEARLVMQASHMALNEVVMVSPAVEEKTSPSPEMGYRRYKKYLEEELHFPPGDTTTQKAVVVLMFRVNAPDGSIDTIVPLKTPGSEYTEEATRLLLEGPSWKPATGDGNPMEDWVRLRIVFKR